MNNIFIAYVWENGQESIFTKGDMSQFLQRIVYNSEIFKIRGGIDQWNKYVSDVWTDFDDDVYYSKMRPIIDEDTPENTWLTYDKNGDLVTLHNYKKSLKKEYEFLKKHFPNE